jgi:hypothetical protein
MLHTWICATGAAMITGVMATIPLGSAAAAPKGPFAGLNTIAKDRTDTSLLHHVQGRSLGGGGAGGGFRGGGGGGFRGGGSGGFRGGSVGAAPRSVGPRGQGIRGPRVGSPRVGRIPGRPGVRGTAPRFSPRSSIGVRAGARYPRHRFRRPGFAHYYGGWWYPFPWWLGAASYYYEVPVAGGQCEVWHRQCIASWGYGNADYYGCMRYHGCD